MSTKGFSLIELMVVVAIVALLALYSIPAYKKHITRSEITEAISVAESITKGIQIYYMANGSYPSSIEVNGYTVSGSWLNINFGRIAWMIYAPSPDGLGATTGYAISGLSGIDGYTDPSIVSAGPNASQFQFAIRDFNGVIRIACGGYGAPFQNANIPLEYLPSGCKCSNIQGFYIDGTSC